jgi:thioredoxin-like negative regulator of GroEL
MLKITKYSAEWCFPCKQLQKIMDKILPEYGDKILYTVIDVEENADIAEELQIRNVPTMIFEHDGKVVCKLVGLTNENEIKAVINNYIE